MIGVGINKNNLWILELCYKVKELLEGKGDFILKLRGM